MTCDRDPDPNVSPAPTPPPVPADVPMRALTSEELLQGRREILIVHAGETYRLRLTRNGKLILNK